MCVPALIPREHELFLTITRQVFWLIPIACLGAFPPAPRAGSDRIVELRQATCRGENTAAGSAQDSNLCSLFSHQWSGCSWWPPHYHAAKVQTFSMATKYFDVKFWEYHPVNPNIQNRVQKSGLRFWRLRVFYYLCNRETSIFSEIMRFFI